MVVVLNNHQIGKLVVVGQYASMFHNVAYEALLSLPPTLKTRSPKNGLSLFIADLAEHKSRPLDS